MRYIMLGVLFIVSINAYTQVRTGCISGDCKNGEGTYRYMSEDVYKGHFKRGKPDGKGKMEYNDGRVYEGEFKKGKITGNGTMYYPNGDYYKGGWKKGEYDGWGTVYAKNDKVKETGVWKKGQLVNNRISGIVESERWKPGQETKDRNETAEKKKTQQKSTGQNNQEKRKSDLIEDLEEHYKQKEKEKLNYDAEEGDASLTMSAEDCNLLKTLVNSVSDHFDGLYLKQTERPDPHMGKHYKVYDMKKPLFNMSGTYTACDISFVESYTVFYALEDVTEEACNKLKEFVPNCIGSAWNKAEETRFKVVYKKGDNSVTLNNKYLGGKYYRMMVTIK